MVPIFKKEEPEILKTFRETTPGASYNCLAKGIKPAIKKSLLEEQGFICAYCMDSISFQNMRIEHWNPQHKKIGDDLDYSNMLGVCPRDKTENNNCDKHRGNLSVNKQTLKYNPANLSDHTLLQIEYLADGTITSKDKVFSNQLDEVLNLNAEEIKIYRQQIIDSIRDYIFIKKITVLKGNSDLIKKIKAWESFDEQGMHKAYFGVATYWINKLIS